MSSHCFSKIHFMPRSLRLSSQGKLGWSHLGELGIDGRSIKMIFREICDNVNWFHLAQGRDQWQACEHGNEISGSVKDWEFSD
jgi:hypothetical protein